MRITIALVVIFVCLVLPLAAQADCCGTEYLQEATAKMWALDAEISQSYELTVIPEYIDYYRSCSFASIYFVIAKEYGSYPYWQGFATESECQFYYNDIDDEIASHYSEAYWDVDCGCQLFTSFFAIECEIHTEFRQCPW